MKKGQKIELSNDDKFLLNERASLTHNYWLSAGIIPQTMEKERVKEILLVNHQRFPSEKIIYIQEGNELVAWLSYSRENETTVEIDRWHPAVLRFENKQLISAIIAKCEEIVRSSCKQILVSYSYDKSDDLQFIQSYREQYAKMGYTTLEERNFMTLEQPEIQNEELLPKQYSFESINSISLSELGLLAHRIFIDGNDRHMRLPQAEMEKEISSKITKNFMEEFSGIIREDEKLIGLLLVQDRGFDFHIEVIGINKDYRNEGIGSSLIKQVIKGLPIEQEKRLSLGVDVLNVKAEKLYQKLGFKQQSTIVSLIKKLN